MKNDFNSCDLWAMRHLRFSLSLLWSHSFLVHTLTVPRPIRYGLSLQPANHGAPPDFSGHHGQQTAPVLSAPWLLATVGPGSRPWSPSVFPSRDFALLGPVLDDVLGSELHLNGQNQTKSAKPAGPEWAELPQSTLLRWPWRRDRVLQTTAHVMNKLAHELVWSFCCHSREFPEEPRLSAAAEAWGTVGYGNWTETSGFDRLV